MFKDALRVSKYVILTLLKKIKKKITFLAPKVDFGAFSSANFAYFWIFSSAKRRFGGYISEFLIFFHGAEICWRYVSGLMIPK